MRSYLGEILHELAKYKGIEILEGHLMKDHVRSVSKSGGHNEEII